MCLSCSDVITSNLQLIESSRPNDFSVGMSLLEIDGRRSYDLIAKVLGKNYQDVVVNSKQNLVEVTVRNGRQAREVLQAAASRGWFAGINIEASVILKDC